MNVALAYNIRHVKPDINNPRYIKEAEFDEKSTVDGIVNALKTLGHNVYRVEADEKAYLKFLKLKNKINLVFNIAEGLHGRDREAQIPAMLEMLEIPYTGPSPLAYALGLDKIKSKELAVCNGIATAKWLEVNDIKDLLENKIDFYPVIVKPTCEGSSKGITANNYAENFKELEKIVERMLNESKCRSILVEEFLEGKEFTVSILGNPPEVLPIIEVKFDDLPEGMPKFDHYEAKWIHDDPLRGFDPLECPARVSHSLESEIKEVSLKVFKALGMQDWSRVDIRLDRKGKPNFIELNCPPGIIPDPMENSRFPRSARAAGMEYCQMIERILKSACSRYKIEYN